MIHQYINNGYHIVLDVNSGSVHSVDALFYDVVKVLSGMVEDMEKPSPLTEEQKQAVLQGLKEKYSEEVRKYFKGNVVVPDDLEEIIL